LTTPTISLNVTIGTTGAVPTPPAVIWQSLVTYLSSGFPQFTLSPPVYTLLSVATAPGYTVLPGLLIEDILSTDIGAVTLCDSAVVELINSLSPMSANPWLLYQLGQLYGVPVGTQSNTSVFVIFSGPVGYFIPPGMTVTDGTYQYVVQDGGDIGSGGSTAPLYAVATVQGIWTPQPNQVTRIVTSIPAPYTNEITVNNPLSGTPSPGPQTTEAYQAQVINAGLATAQGAQAFLKAQLWAVPGVTQRAVSVRQVSAGWEVIVGGGDPYQVAGAIYQGCSDISILQPSVIGISGVTNANPGVVTTDLYHGFTTGQTGINITGVTGMTGVNGGPYTVTVISPTQFSFGVNTTSSGAYTGGGSVTPNPRNQSITVIDPPDTYEVLFVVPPTSTVQVQVGWATDSPNVVSSTAVQNLGGPAVAAYINAIVVGQPINLIQAQQAFSAAVASALPTQYLSQVEFTITIDGVEVAPEGGTQLVYGDPESLLFCAANGVTVTEL